MQEICKSGSMWRGLETEPSKSVTAPALDPANQSVPAFPGRRKCREDVFYLEPETLLRISGEICVFPYSESST